MDYNKKEGEEMFDRQKFFNYLKRLELLKMLNFLDEDLNFIYDLSKISHEIITEPINYINKFKVGNLKDMKEIRALFN